MTVLDNLNIEETKEIEELRARFKNSLSSEIYNDTIHFYRFLKARNFDIDKAETLLRKNLAWRKAFQVDNILERLQPEEILLKYVTPNFLGFDKEGNIVNHMPSGKIDARDMYSVYWLETISSNEVDRNFQTILACVDVQKCVKINDLEKYFIWLAEKDVLRINTENERTGRKAYQCTYIFDLDCILFGNLTSKAATDQFLRITYLMQDNYPERLKSVYVINAPAYFKIFFSVLKKVMSNEMLQKIHVFGRDGWKEALRKVIDLDVLPAFLGGNRTDPDGDPFCRTILRFGGKIPPKYFLSPEEKTFKDKNQVRKLRVSPRSSVQVPTEVKDLGSVIQCEFEVKSKDIGFGLFFKKSEGNLEDVLPIQRFVTNDGTEAVSFKPRTIGTYVIIFDNSYSWFNSKEVHYCVTVQKP